MFNPKQGKFDANSHRVAAERLETSGANPVSTVWLPVYWRKRLVWASESEGRVADKNKR